MKLDDYIKGDRHGREAHEVELDSQRDPLLGEAIDGFEKVSGDHSAVLEGLEARLAERIEGLERAALRRKMLLARRRRIRVWSVAAAAVVSVFLGVGGWLYTQNKTLEGYPLATLPHSEYKIDINGMVPEGGVRVVGVGTASAVTAKVAVREGTTVASVSEGGVVAAKIAQDDDDTVLAARIALSSYADIAVPEDPIIAATVATSDDKAFGTVASVHERDVIAATSVSEGAVIAATVAVSEGGVVAAKIAVRERAVAVPDDALPDNAILAKNTPAPDDAILAKTTPARDTTVPAIFRQFLAIVARENITRSSVPDGGYAIVLFEVNGSGRPENGTVIESSSPEAGNAALELLRGGPDWDTDKPVKQITVRF